MYQRGLYTSLSCACLQAMPLFLCSFIMISFYTNLPYYYLDLDWDWYWYSAQTMLTITQRWGMLLSVVHKEVATTDMMKSKSRVQVSC